MLPFRTILHATDFSENADYAYEFATLIARECSARLIVLYVAGAHIDLPQPIHTDVGLAFDTSMDYKKHDADLKQRLRERFESNPDVRVETQLIYAKPADGILAVADEVRCDLIVMGTHGRGGLLRLLMGSVAESVMRNACCPVLTIHSPCGDKTAADAATAAAPRPSE
jgi:nucleotide-binding universal stress UspA family protein